MGNKCASPGITLYFYPLFPGMGTLGVYIIYNDHVCYLLCMTLLNKINIFLKSLGIRVCDRVAYRISRAHNDLTVQSQCEWSLDKII